MNKAKHPVFSFLSICFKCYKPYFFVTIFSCIIKGGLTIFNAYSLSIVIRYLELNNEKNALLVGLIIVVINFIFNFLNKYITRLNNIHELAMVEAVNMKIGLKLTKIDYQYLEDPYYLDLKEKAKFANETFACVKSFLNSFAIMVQYIVTLLGLATIMLMFDFYLVLILMVGILFNILFISITFKARVKFYKDLMPINRKFGYYINTLLDERKSKDHRMYNIGSFILKKFKSYGDETLKVFNRLASRLSLTSVASEVVKYLQMGLIYGFVAYKVILNNLPISVLSLYISTAISFSSIVTSLIDTSLSWVRTISYVNPFVELFAIPESKDSGKQIPFTNEIETIEFDHVTFSYPKSDNIILNDISFKINKGEKISIVGLNGAGKTTLVKILCRLYRPSSGNIYINGISIYDYKLDDYKQKISAVFQDFKLFAYTLKENIINDDNDEAKAYEMACNVGLKQKIDSLPLGINSLYTKSYDEGGIELSGGEAQKVAIARALYRNSSLVILDEPTSALDPLAEADIYANFNSLVKEKTAVFISHRMSSSVFCDKILIIDGGKVKDFDTHQNLMKQEDSLYYKLFMSQANNYTS